MMNPSNQPRPGQGQSSGQPASNLTPLSLSVQAFPGKEAPQAEANDGSPPPSLASFKATVPGKVKWEQIAQLVKELYPGEGTEVSLKKGWLSTTLTVRLVPNGGKASDALFNETVTFNSGLWKAGMYAVAAGATLLASFNSALGFAVPSPLLFGAGAVALLMGRRAVNGFTYEVSHPLDVAKEIKETRAEMVGALVKAYGALYGAVPFCGRYASFVNPFDTFIKENHIISHVGEPLKHALENIYKVTEDKAADLARQNLWDSKIGLALKRAEAFGRAWSRDHLPALAICGYVFYSTYADTMLKVIDTVMKVSNLFLK